LTSTWQLLTKRLRPYRLDDATALFAVFGDPELMRYSMSGADPSVEATHARIQKLMDHQASFGFSLWVAEDRATAAVLGDSGLKQPEDGLEIDRRIEDAHRPGRDAGVSSVMYFPDRFLNNAL
jgi:RimJ/RimL family protein N-acetyltransferase